MTLQEQIREVLAKLSTLSEANASNLEPRTSGSKSLSRPPAGVSSKRALAPTDPDRPPPKERSLYDWFCWKFQHADPADHEHLEKLVQLADVEYKARALHVPRRLALRSGKLDASEEDGAVELRPRAYFDDSERPNPSKETEDAAATRIVEWYEGWSAIEVAFAENTTEAWVLKARKQHKRNPDDGRPRPPFLDWDHEERQRQVDLLRGRARSEGREIGAKTIAQHFGVDKNTVKRYLERPPVAA